jgi:hypothetical protein
LPDDLRTSTLCFPDGLKSCFACCPPIRPAGYEHLTHQNIIRRILRENTGSFVKKDRTTLPIRGFSCWALGYLDEDCLIAGCLLHPCQNDGVDLRFRVDYGEKCQRESCPEAKTFEKLSPRMKEFWIHLADGLDSFSYSARSTSLLFRMINWGALLLELICAAEGEEKFTGESFLKAYPFFTTPLPPRGHAYLLSRLVDDTNLHWLRSPRFRDAFERLASDLQSLCRAQGSGNAGRQARSYVHLLPLDRNLSDLLRLTLHVTQASLEDALAIKEKVDASIEMLRKESLEGLNRPGTQP